MMSIDVPFWLGKENNGFEAENNGFEATGAIACSISAIYD
jgi:hypothetical protein